MNHEYYRITSIHNFPKTIVSSTPPCSGWRPSLHSSLNSKIHSNIIKKK